MDEDQRLQLLGFFPERIEARRGDLFALDAAADGGAVAKNNIAVVAMTRMK